MLFHKQLRNPVSNSRGQVKIRVDPCQHPNQYPSLYPLGNIADLEKEKARELLRQ